jgi:hypothetical protein
MPYAQDYYLKLAARKAIERGGCEFPTPQRTRRRGKR